jgi:cytochrome c oxidase subunit 4
MSHPHVVPIPIYLAVFAALMVGTALTVWVAFIDLGALNDVAMLTIAVTKAVLVVLFFMHVRYSGRLTGFVVSAGFVWLAIMLALTLQDYLTRDWLGVPGK